MNESVRNEINAMFDDLERSFENVDVSKLPKGQTGPYPGGIKGSTGSSGEGPILMELVDINGCMVPQFLSRK